VDRVLRRWCPPRVNSCACGGKLKNDASVPGLFHRMQNKLGFFLRARGDRIRRWPYFVDRVRSCFIPYFLNIYYCKAYQRLIQHKKKWIALLRWWCPPRVKSCACGVN
jgi:hypothetical protein